MKGAKGDYRVVHPIIHVNMSQSTNDVFPTAIRIATLRLAAQTQEALHGLVEIVEMKEVVNQVAFHVTGNDITISRAAEAGQLELNVMEPVLVFNLLQSLDILRNVMIIFGEKCLKGITANSRHRRDM